MSISNVILILLLITVMAMLVYDVNEQNSYSASLLGKEAIVNSSMVLVVIIEYDRYNKKAKCRVDNGDKATPRYQEVIFFLNELTVQPK
jgi:hypothetical protein